MNTAAQNGRRERLVQSAKTAFVCQGFYVTTISEIVQQAGMARGTFYQYFDNKLYLFQSILDSFLQALQGCIRPVSLSSDAPPPMDQIRNNLTRVLHMVLEERDLTQILLHHTGTVSLTLEEHINSFYLQVAQMIERSLWLGDSRVRQPFSSDSAIYQLGTIMDSIKIKGAVYGESGIATQSREPRSHHGEGRRG